MAIKSTLPECAGRSLDVRTNLGDNGRAESYVGYEVTIHDVDCMMAEVRSGSRDAGVGA